MNSPLTSLVLPDNLWLKYQSTLTKRSVRNGVLILLLGLAALCCCGAVHGITPMLAVGRDHTVALQNNGALVSWGDDTSGQLGLGRQLQSATPLPVFGLDGATMVAAGDRHTLVLMKDGTVKAWGYNQYGQLGDGSTTDRSTPVQVSGLKGVKSIAAAFWHSFALKDDGTVWAWGYGTTGQLGLGYIAYPNTPVQVPGISGVIAISTNWGHTLALKQDGSVWAWGFNQNGQLGDGSTLDRLSPVQVPGLTGIKAIAAGYWHSVVVKSDGTVWTWGGDLKIPRTSPFQVMGLTNVTSVAAENGDAVASRIDGTVWKWPHGFNPAPSQVPGFANVTRVFLGNNYIVAVSKDGTAWAFGANYSGQLGDGTTTSPTAPVQIALPGVTSIAGGIGYGAFTVAAKADGSVWVWGSNSNGQFGSGAVTLHNIPSSIPGISGVTSVAAGDGHTLALLQNGSVWAWGHGQAGSIGDGANTNRSAPVQVTGLTNVTKVAAGGYYSLALKSDGTVWSWGNTNGSTDFQGSSPVRVLGLTEVTAISTGGENSFAIRSDGTVWGWGRNYFGALGDGTQTGRRTPVQVPNLTGFKVIAAGNQHTIGLKTDGTVWAWGDNSLGQLGDGTTTTRLTPVRVANMTEVVAVGAGISISFAIKGDGSAWAWGEDSYGRLGDGWKGGNQMQPFQVVGLNRTSQIVGVASQSVALKQDGTVLAWGYNQNGQVGDGTLVNFRTTPVSVLNAAADGLLDLSPDISNSVSAAQIPPFLLVASGSTGGSASSISTSTKFNPSDKGKSGSIYVTAVVPPGTLGDASVADSPLKRAFAAKPQQLASLATCAAATNSLSLIQLTPSGWQPVVNGQLIPYASGVLGDQLAAQTILSGTDTTNLKGAEFCVGYGTSAQDMINNGNIRAVATIPGATASSTCVVGGALSIALSVSPGWNLLGNPINQTLMVAEKFGGATKVNSVWKWDISKSNWQFYAPDMDATSLQSYANSNGYSVLTEIGPGDGYWVQAKVQADLGSICGSSINLRESSLASGWNLVSTASLHVSRMTTV